MQVGDTYRENGKTRIWSRCPDCLEERGVHKQGPSPLVLCKDCAKKVARRLNNRVWYIIYNKED